MPAARPLSRLLLLVPVPWVFVLAYLVGVIVERAYTPPAWPHPSGALLVGALLFAAGAVVAGWSLALFRGERTTTTPGERSAALVTRGPYRLTRNPMYVGLTLAYLGEAGMLRETWPIVLLPLVLLYVNGVVIPLEETRMREAFGEAYADYARRVRRWL